MAMALELGAQVDCNPAKSIPEAFASSQRFRWPMVLAVGPAQPGEVWLWWKSRIWTARKSPVVEELHVALQYQGSWGFPG